MNRFSLSSIVFLFLITFQILPTWASESHKSCLDVINAHLEKVGGTLDFYIKESDKSVEQRGHKAPSFKNMMEDKRHLDTMTGTKGPYLLSKTLPSNTYFIDHPLFMPNEPGVVKTATGGETVPLRVMVDYKGKKIGANVLTLRTALFDNVFRDQKSLVPADAKAVFVFMHGGGTKTTGSHVGISIANHLNHYGIATIAIDMPWHAEGPREFFRDSKDFFGWIRALLSQFVTVSGKPIIIGGHSMGGEFADMYMRNYPSDDLVKAVISLSPPVDPVPGRSIHERLVAQANGYAHEVPKDQLNEDNLKILNDLLVDGKNSPSGIYFESQISANNNWAIPADGGASFVPSLFVWGAADYLYVGREQHVQDYIGRLKNAEMKIYGERTVIGGQREVIGHLIFDHYAEGEQAHELEAYADIRNFIQKILGENLVKENRKMEHMAANFLNIIKEYSYNLAFREFIKNMKITRKIPNNPEKLAKISQEIAELTKRIDKEVMSPEEKKELKRRYDQLQELRAGKFIPDGPEGEDGRILDKAIEKISEEITVANNRNKSLKKTIETLSSELNGLKRDLEHRLMTAVHKNPDGQLAFDNYQLAVAELSEAAAKVDKAVNTHLQSLYKEGKTPTEVELVPPQELLFQFEKYETIDYPEFAKKKEEYHTTLTHLAQAGAFGPGLRDLSEKIHRLEAELHIYTTEDKNLQMLIFQSGLKSEAYRARLAELYNSELYRVETYSFDNVLELEYSDMLKYTFAIQDYWKKWKQIWNDRVAGEKMSLY